jgi:hypothetical protein
MSSLCTGKPPGEFTDTAKATARVTLIYASLFYTDSVLLFIFSLFFTMMA